MNEWKCSLRDEPGTLHILLYVYRETSYGEIEYATIGESGSIFLNVGKRYEPLKPFLTLTDLMAKELFKGLADCLDKSGYKPMSFEKAEGTLEATKFHLSDLRQLLKLTK